MPRSPNRPIPQALARRLRRAGYAVALALALLPLTATTAPAQVRQPPSPPNTRALGLDA